LDLINPVSVFSKSGSGTEAETFNGNFLALYPSFHHSKSAFSWGGFTNPVKLDAKKDFFRIRLWDQGDVVDGPTSGLMISSMTLIKAEIPLKSFGVGKRQCE